MVENIKTTFHISKKDYKCDACLEAFDCCIEYAKNTKMTFTEMRAVITAKNNGWKIKKGQRYIKQFNKMDGDVFVYSAIPEIMQISTKYNLRYDS